MKRGETDESDVELMLRIARGDRNAFEHIYRRYSGHVINFAYRYLGDRDMAEEAMQEVFLKLYRHAPKYRPTASFKTYLFSITINHCLNELRGRVPATGGHEISTNNERAISDSDKDGQPQTAFIKNELNRAVLSALNALPENQRAAMLMVTYYDMSYEEISEVLRCSVKAVKSLLHRARENLKPRLRLLMEAEI